MSPRRRAPVRTGRTPAANGAAGARALADGRELKKLAVLMEESGLVELEIDTGAGRVRLVRGRAVEPAAAPAEPGPARSARQEAGVESAARVITSPVVGTFHRAPAPEAPPFAEVGDIVERGQVLCLIEAMKMMNEIEAEFRGRLVKILIENDRPVEYGEPLFLVEPL
ncbi:MAG: acetyl-CoA carboxylase biotin carboxyl carrier protein [Myxococcales bacterium]|nr:acetyl-CoA carboxylase biotin carboxyl carrier protein [Myxococcales bacterium]